MSFDKKLSPRELEILQFISDGFTDKEMAVELTISSKTVSTHRKNILKKLELKNTALLIRFALENKLVK